jgi:hypothetical protein
VEYRKPIIKSIQNDALLNNGINYEVAIGNPVSEMSLRFGEKRNDHQVVAPPFASSPAA